jgi:hypothetical protein
MISDSDTVANSAVPDPREEIVEYLREHPSAADTVDGVLLWWLAHQRYVTAKEAIQNALDDLVRQGIIDYLDIGDDKRIYFSADRPRKSQQ